MPTTDLSIGRDAVVDFQCSGWPSDKRTTLMNAVAGLIGVTGVNGAGISTMRVSYDTAKVDPAGLTAAVCQLADALLPGHSFSA